MEEGLAKAGVYTEAAEADTRRRNEMVGRRGWPRPRVAVGRVEGAWQLGGLGLGEKGTDVEGEPLGLANGLGVRSEEKR